MFLLDTLTTCIRCDKDKYGKFRKEEPPSLKWIRQASSGILILCHPFIQESLEGFTSQSISKERNSQCMCAVKKRINQDICKSLLISTVP